MATCLIHLSHLFPLFMSFPSLSPVTSFLTGRVTPHENVTAAILSYVVSHLHEGTGKLRKTCADTVGHLTESVPSLTVSEKWPPAQRFDVQAADRRSPIRVLTQRKAAWPGWWPGTGHLPHTEHCRWGHLIIYSIIFPQFFNYISALLWCERNVLGIFNIDDFLRFLFYHEVLKFYIT